jgi:hypothetical protein
VTRLHVLLLHASIAVSALTGVVFAVMKYFLTSPDEFAVANHPLQPHMLSLHVVISPIALFVLGWTFSNHMLPKFRFGGPPRRRTGIVLMVLIAPMVLSAYLLQISTNDTLRQAMAIAHWISSGVFTVGYLLHLWTKTPNGAPR